MITARELRSHFSPLVRTRVAMRPFRGRDGVCLCGRPVAEHFDAANRKRSCGELATARRPTSAAASSSEVLARAVGIESLTIAPDAMPGHYIARAVIFDLQPTQMVPAIIAVEDRIRAMYPGAHRSGWSACSDGLRIYFYASTPIGAAAAQTAEAA